MSKPTTHPPANMAASSSATLSLANEIARRANAPIEQVWGYFSWNGRLTTEAQQRISAADVEILGMRRDRRTRRRRVNLMNYADFWLENMFQGQPVSAEAA